MADFNKLRKGMTEEQVEKILGCPAGIYSNQDLMRPVRLRNGPPITGKLWATEDLEIEVVFDSSGKAIRASALHSQKGGSHLSAVSAAEDGNVESFDHKVLEELVKGYIYRVKKWPDDSYYIRYPIHKTYSGHYIVDVIHKGDEDQTNVDAMKSTALEVDLVNKTVGEAGGQ
jgi:hypothetical protein